MIYQFLTILYWLVLSVWVGSTVYVAAAGAVVFRVLRRREVRLPEIQSNALRDEHATLLGGDIMGALLGRMGQIHIICMAAMLPLLVLLALYAQGTWEWAAMGARVALYAAASYLILRDWRTRFPITLRARQEYVEHADEPEVAEKAKAEYEASQRRAERTYQAVLFVLLGLLLASANPAPRESELLKPKQQPLVLPQQ
jgi:hypothetical protein